MAGLATRILEDPSGASCSQVASSPRRESIAGHRAQHALLPIRRSVSVLGLAAVLLMSTAWFAPASASDLELLQSGNGFEPLLPYRIEALDSNGNPTGVIVNIRSI
ncbi:MAG: hypothetical protein ACI835_004717 [Planctomycetota bacterium]|jgi:hypothetical protein